jgi:hypothetical protein
VSPGTATREVEIKITIQVRLYNWGKMITEVKLEIKPKTVTYKGPAEVKNQVEALRQEAGLADSLNNRLARDTGYLVTATRAKAGERQD